MTPPHNPGMTMMGAAMLWVGWFGFNAGKQLWVQFVGVAATVVWAGLLTYVIVKLVGALVRLRVSEDVENEGLDITAHGERGYHW